MRFNLLIFLGPGFAGVRGAVGRPGEAIGLDVVVADPQNGSVSGGDAELLLDVDFTTNALRRSHVLQAAAFDHADEFPSIEPGVVGTQGRGDVPGFAVVANDAEFIEDLSGGKTHGGP